LGQALVELPCSFRRASGDYFYLGYLAEFIQGPSGRMYAIAGGAFLLFVVLLPELLSDSSKKENEEKKKKKKKESSEEEIWG
jgi:hypothetical protein